MTIRLSKISLVAVLGLIVLASASQFLTGASAAEPGIVLKFSPEAATVAPGSPATVAVYAENLPAGVDTVQVAVQFDSADLSVTGARCAGLFEGADATGIIEINAGSGVAFACADSDTPPAGSSGPVAEIDLARTGAGETTVSFVTSGHFPAAFISGGTAQQIASFGTLFVTDSQLAPGFYFDPDSMSLDDGDETAVDIMSGTVVPGSAHSVQVTIAHDSSVIAITDAECAGLYEGASRSPLAVVESGAATSFVCTLEGAPLSDFGRVATVSFQRVGAGDEVLTFLATGPFRTAFINDGNQVSQGALGTLSIDDPAPAATATPSPTPTTPPSGGGGGGGPAPQATSTPVPAGPSAPSVPLNVTAAPGDESVEISWSPPANTGGAPVTAYRILNINTGTASTVNAPAVSTVITGLQNGTAYSFQVQAVNSAGPGPSVVVGPVTPAGLPGAPGDVEAALGAGGAITVSWSAPESDGGSPITAYVVTLADGTELVSVDATGPLEANVLGLTQGASHSFAVRAQNAVGTGPASATSTPIFFPVSSPGDPSPETSLVPQMPGTNDALQDAALAAFGSGVTVLDEPLVFNSGSDGPLDLVIAVSGLTVGSGGPQQFNVASQQLTIETDETGHGSLTASIGEGLSISGAAQVSVGAGGLLVEVEDAVLSYSPVTSGDPGAVSGIEFSVELKRLPDGSELAATFSTDVPSEITGAAFILGASGPGLLSGPADVAAVVTVTKTALSNTDLGDNTVSMNVSAEWFEERTAQGKEIVITKVSDTGEMFTEPAVCSAAGTGYLCVATFSGPGGGFSDFALLALSAIEPPAPTPSATAVTPSASPTATPAQPEPVANPTVSPSPTQAPTPLPEPTPVTALITPDSSGGFPVWGWVVTGVLVLVAARVIYYVARRSIV